MYDLIQNDSVIMSNISTDFELNNLHSHLYGSTWGNVGYFFMAFLENIVVGPVLHLGIVIFECFGGDPQKRNVINRLLSLCCVNQILFAFLVGFCQVWRGTFGLIDVHIMSWIEGLAQIFGTSVILGYNEMTILRFLYIVVWKRVVELDDKLWTFVLCIINYSWCCCIVIINKQSSAVSLPLFKMYTGNLPESFNEIW